MILLATLQGQCYGPLFHDQDESHTATPESEDQQLSESSFQHPGVIFEEDKKCDLAIVKTYFLDLLKKWKQHLV